MKMKKLFFLVLILCLSVAASGLCEDLDLSGMTTEQLAELQSRIQDELDNRPADYDVIISEALDVLRDGWEKEYAKTAVPGTTYSIDIRGVRLIQIKDQLDGKEAEIFGGIRYLIEFLMYDDYFSSGTGMAQCNAGYMMLSGMNSTVVVDRNNQMALQGNNLIRLYTARTYNYDYSLFIEKVVDFHEQYNQVIAFTFD